MLQFVNLFTGVMTDQPVTFKNALSVGTNQGAGTPPVRVYGAVGQTGHLIDLYPSASSLNPGWGVGALGQFAWGPGGSTVQDTFLSRIATQNGHTSDTAGLLINPYLEVLGGLGFDGPLTWKTSGAVITQGGAGSFAVSISQDLYVSRSVGIGTGPILGYGLVMGGSYSTYAMDIGPILTGTTSVGGLLLQPTAGATISGNLEVLQTAPQTAASTTVPGVIGIHVFNVTKGSGSTVTSDYGMIIEAQTAGATNNFGLYVAPPSGGSTNNWGIYNLGTSLFNLFTEHLGSGRFGGQIIPATGAGVEIGRTATPQGYITSYNRSAGTYEPLILQASLFQFQQGLVDVLTTARFGGYIVPSTGSGLEIGTTPAPLSFIVAYNRSGSAYLDLSIQAKNISLTANAGGTVSVTGGAFIPPANAITSLAGSQPFGTFGSITFSTTSSTYVAITGFAVTLTTTGKPVWVTATGSMTNTAVNTLIAVGIGIDGGVVQAATRLVISQANGDIPFHISSIWQPAAGSHTWQVYMNTNAGTAATDVSTSFTLYAIEYKF
jgi:hypothetical protein